MPWGPEFPGTFPHGSLPGTAFSKTEKTPGKTRKTLDPHAASWPTLKPSGTGGS